MIFKQIKSGGDRNFAYLIGCQISNKCVLIDPSPDPQICEIEVEKTGLELVYIINTHSHIDHIAGNDYFCKDKKIKLITHPKGNGDLKIEDTKEISLSKDKNSLNLMFLYTPGHTGDSICIKAENNLVTGDTLFVGKVGGTYTEEDAREEFNSLIKIMKLPSKTIIWPGHNYGTSSQSTIETEIKTNPFIKKLNEFEDFIWLKNNWAEFKLKNNIK